MPQLDAFIHVLAAALEPNPNVRAALADTVLAAMSVDQPHSDSGRPLSYLEIIEQAAQRGQHARTAGHTRLEASLQQLSRQLTLEVHRSALELHRSLSAGRAPDLTHVRRVGIDLTDFPIRIDRVYDLRALSERYLTLTQDLHTLTDQAPGHFPELVERLRQERQTAGRGARDVAWEALSTGLFPDMELLRFADACRQAWQGRGPAAEQNLRTIFLNQSPDAVAAVIPRLTDWLYDYGRLHWPLLPGLRPESTPLVVQALVRIPDPIGLEALAAMPVKESETALLFALLSIRFGVVKPLTIDAWAAWLQRIVETATRRREALEFWNAYPYLLPALVVDGWRESALSSDFSIDIPPALTRHMLAELGGGTVADVLARWQHRPAGLDIRSERPDLAQSAATRAAPDDASPLAYAVEGVVEAALNAAQGGNLAAAALTAALDGGAKGLRPQLTVTVDDDAPPPHQTARIGFAAARPTPAPQAAKAADIRAAIAADIRAAIAADIRAAIAADIDIWQDRIWPFVMQNWAPLLGGSMVLAGLLLLEFYIWDKAAWMRYGVSPVIIALVALALTIIARRLNRPADAMESSLAIIQGVAVFLAPLSVLFVTLFVSDSSLALRYRLPGGLALAALLLAAWSGVFVLAMTGINRRLTRLYSGTLLLLNGLLLLLPAAQLMAADGAPVRGWLTPEARAMFVIGFYLGFGALALSIGAALKMTLKSESRAPQGLIFYSVTSVGAFALVWGLTHAYLRALPQTFTYGPLLTLAALVCLRLEFALLDHRRQRLPATSGDPASGGRITTLSYAAYALIGLGLLLSIGQEYARVGVLLLAGAVWAYQAHKLRQMPDHQQERGAARLRHENIALTLVTLGLSLVAMLRHFPAGGFPLLAFGIALGLHLLAEHTPLFTGNPYATALSPVYLALAFVVSVPWQWAQRLNPFGFGAAFALFAVFMLYLGARNDRLIHVHAGMAYGAAALPYLGLMDLELFTLEGNTLVFGLAVIGLAWAALSSLAPIPAFRHSRSTVLWNLGILAFCLLCARVLWQSPLNFAETSGWLQFQILSAPLLIGGLMLLVGYWSNSYPAIYLALIIFIFIFPEIKDQLMAYDSVRALSSSGLGTSLTAASLIALAYLLSFWPALRAARSHDLIWRQKSFPFQAPSGFRLFAQPLMAGALFLLSRNLFYTYPRLAVQRPPMVSLLTCLAVLLAGSGYLALSLWHRTRWLAYAGFLAIIVGSLHAGLLEANGWFAPAMLPTLLLLACGYGEGLCAAAARVVPARAIWIARPFRHVRVICVWGVALTAAAAYPLFHASLADDGRGLWRWLPLLLYCGGVAGWQVWRSAHLRQAWLNAIPGYLLVWQIALLVVASGWARPGAAAARFHLTTLGTVLILTAIVAALQCRAPAERVRLLSPILWISLAFLGWWSRLVMSGFYANRPLAHLAWQVALLAAISLILGRALRMAWLWLWALVLLHVAFLRPAADYAAFYRATPPMILAALACGLALLAVLTRAVPWLYAQSYRWPWSSLKGNRPPIVFGLASQTLALLAVVQASVHPAHQATWPTVIGLFLATLPAVLVAPDFSLSRRLLGFFPYIGAWIVLALAIQVNLGEALWNLNLPLPLLVACGLFGATAALVAGDRFRPSQDCAYLTLRYAAVTAILAGVALAYLPLRNIQALSWQWLLVSAVLLFGSAMFFKRWTKL
jgi:hypothetical protein